MTSKSPYTKTSGSVKRPLLNAEPAGVWQVLGREVREARGWERGENNNTSLARGRPGWSPAAKLIEVRYFVFALG